MALPPEPHFKAGDHIPGTEYVVIRLEAEGGHGALYLVHHHFLEKKLQMLKTLRSFHPSPDLIERLKREAQMLAGMDHPHIVSVTSGGLTDEKNPRPYFVMERLKGKSLAQILPNAPDGVGIDAALRVTIEVCDALEYIHTRHNVVHRDIKPDNIFLQVTPRNGSVTKLLDFGVAHMMDLEKRYTSENLFLGTPRYASPEQIMGDKPTPRTDLYAVGLLLYELLLGRGPFDDATNFATIATAHTQRPPPPFPTTRRFPEGLEPLVMSLLAKDPEQRPKSAEWLATRLRQIKRIAELAEHADAQDLNRTELSPMQNVLTGHRGEMTEAGFPPDVASERALGAPVDPTSKESPLGFNSTARAVPVETRREGAGGAAGAKPPIDRKADTRSLQFPAPGPKQSDTEELPGARAWTPPPEIKPMAVEVAPPPGAASTGVSATGAVEITRDPPASEVPRKYRLAAVVGVCGGLSVFALAFAVIHSMASKDTQPSSTAAPPVEVAAPAASAPPAVASATATGTPSPAAPPPTQAPEPQKEAASAPVASPPTAATPTASAKRATSPRAQPPKAPPLRLPPSGL